jgi:hypothetical protein
MKKEIYKIFGWHFMVKEIADFTRCTFFEIMEKPAIEISGLATVMYYKTLYTKTN